MSFAQEFLHSRISTDRCQKHQTEPNNPFASHTKTWDSGNRVLNQAASVLLFCYPPMHASRGAEEVYMADTRMDPARLQAQSLYRCITGISGLLNIHNVHLMHGAEAGECPSS